MRETSLDEFRDGENESEEDADPATEGDDADDSDTDADEEVDAGADELTGPSESVDADADDAAPAVSTYEWTPDGAVCEACGATAGTRWRDDDRLVCPDCKAW